jgi:hypothetical protein
MTSEIWGSPFFDISVDHFAQGAILARTKNQRYGLLNRDGSKLVQPHYERIGWVAPGVAVAWSRLEGGLIGRDGQWIFKNNDRYRVARFGSKNARKIEPHCRHGLVVIEDSPKWGYASLKR